MIVATISNSDAQAVGAVVAAIWGVTLAYVWILDPKTRLAYRWTAEGMHQIPELRTENPAIVVPLADLFEA